MPDTLRAPRCHPILPHATSHPLGRSATNAIAAADHTVHVLPAPAHVRAKPFDFGAAEALIEAGYRAVGQALAHVRGNRRAA